ncbi:hypothetical protein [uncultured Mycobacterium sp.]|uniref:hypothetical protein n=1 Tax=uncultured Mycobacterium sp. TaxID=171292 RepID=UPI0035CA19F5
MAEAEALGRANQDAIDLTRAHCRHARIEMPYGNSPFGSAMGWPLARMEVDQPHPAHRA